MKPGRNDPCHCGSGRKFKKCCQGREAATAATPDSVAAEALTQAEFSQLASLFNAGRYVELENRARLLIGQYPNNGFIWKVLGVALQKQGKYALVALQNAAELLPLDSEAHIMLADACKRLGNIEPALASYRQALAINPGNADVHVLMGNALVGAGKLGEAVESYQQALMIRPDYAEVISNLGNVLKELGRFNEAVAIYRRAVELKPDYAAAHSNLGNALEELGQFREAVACCRTALAISPDMADAHNNLGNALKNLGQLKEAEASYRWAIATQADFALAHNNLGTALQDLGQLEEAQASYRRALEIKADYADAHSNLLFLNAYYCQLEPCEHLVQACEWEQECVPEQARQAGAGRVFSRSALDGRRLRVGYVSGDFHQHAVSYFIEQIFAYHDKTRIELFAYSNTAICDATSLRLQGLAENWLSVVGLADSALLERIDQDGIDVLIDLSGHTARNRLAVFAQRAAPVQAHYLGYFASTGLTEIDYWIGDAILTPVENDGHFSEQVWRLPRVWVSYDGKADAPVTDRRPSPDGSVWLGSFNNLGKLTPETLSLWAKVLHALPEGRLLLKTRALADADNCQRIMNVLAGHGISAERIELQDGSGTPEWRAHMACYDRLDIALDPVGGVGGGTTSCDALWMGAPVITLEGDRMASRMTSAMLDAIGHSEWTAHCEAEYVDKVVALARDMNLRQSLRPDQRSRMAESPLCDARGLVRSLEDGYFAMFAHWQALHN